MIAPSEQRRVHDDADPHVHARWLSDLVLGAQDGVVNTLGVVLGVAAASASAHVTFAAGLAAGVAEAISTAAVAYTSSAARGELYDSERRREYRHIESVPDLERDEIRAIYAAKGFRSELLERVVETICANKDVWVAVMMKEEHGLDAVDRRASGWSAVIVGASALVGSVLPVMPFALLPRMAAVGAALAVGAAALFVLGAYKARVTTGRHSRSGLALAAIGLASALAGYVVGAALG